MNNIIELLALSYTFISDCSVTYGSIFPLLPSAAGYIVVISA